MPSVRVAGRAMAWVVALAVAGGACGGSAPGPAAKSTAAAAAHPGAAASGKAPAAAVPAPASTTEQDALWALAPEGARLGLVASPHGVAMFERGWHTIQDLLSSSFDLVDLNTEVMRGLLAALGTPSPTLAEFGLTHDRGFAMFVVGAATVVIVPVADRGKFVDRLHGTRGPSGDIVGGFACRAIGARYACSEHRAALDQLGRGGLDTARRTVAARGDVELAVRRIGAGAGAASVTAAVAVVTPGAILVHGAITGPPPAIADRLGAPVQPRPGSAVASSFGAMDLRPYLGALAAIPLAGGVTLDQLGHSLAGSGTFVIAAGSTDLGIRLPLTDPAPAGRVIEHCGELRLFGDGAAVKDGACHLPPSGNEPVQTDWSAWVEAGELRIGTRGGAAAPVAVAPTALSRELAQGAWAFALFGRASMFIGGKVPTPKSGSARLASLAGRASPLISELGGGIRRDGDALHFVVGLRTVWANPGDIGDKLAALAPADFASGKAAELARSLAAATPTAPLADDLKCGAAGLLATSTVSGLITGVVVPALFGPSSSP